jgi:PIN domain nuclease of toxin-antitoxin system
VPASLLLDTHILLRWFAEPKRLSREQKRAIHQAMSRHEPVAISAVSLIEAAIILREISRIDVSIHSLFRQIEEMEALMILPPTTTIALEVAALGKSLRDPADRAIVATARVHRLKLVTSDQRIIDSELVAVVD